ncbi:MAG: hypothetical protein E5W40_04740 [Mesorhizobium sp.]|nr:MAG: hypothetical protein E5W40_04740 [Mesorhizobium sp.]
MTMNLTWMAWTLPTAIFFITILVLLCGMAIWEYASPGFLSLLGSAFIHLAWLGLVGPNLWWALALSVVYAIGVFRYV